ncbi:sigma-70 family RNA polymerase sigma factor [Streptomyces griseoruber]
MIDRLTAALSSATDMTAEEILDVLLLCGRRPLPDRPPQPGTPASRTPPLSAGPPAAPAAPAALPEPSHSGPELRLSPEHTTTTAEPATGIGLDAPAPISDPLAVPRALRRFRRVRAPSPHPSVDIEASVEATAEAGGRLVLVHTREQKHALDVVLVTDGHPSVRIWDETLDAFARLLARTGAFRAVTRCTLVDEGAGPRLRDARGVLHPPRYIVDPSGHRLVLLATDATAEPWYHPPLWAALATWCRTMPVALVQLLPSHYWSTTAVGDPYLAVRARRPGGPNQHYEQRLAWWADIPRGAPLPVVTLAPDTLEAWVRAVVDGSAWTDAISADPPEVGYAPSRTDASAPQTLVNSFLALASEGAEQLAHTLSLARVLSVPLMRVLQDRLVPGTGTAELAEVLAAGLLRPIGPVGSGRLRFHDGVGELLARGTTAFDEWAAYEAVTRYLEDRGHAPGPLRALVADPEGTALLDPDDEPFAELRNRLAGRFTRAVTTASGSGGEQRRRAPAGKESDRLAGRGPSGGRAAHPLVVGSIPAAAAPFQPRTATREDIDRPLTRATAVRTQVLSGPGGAGKTQLAAAYAREAVADGVDVVVWVNATDTQAVVSAYAQAARLVRALPGAPVSAQADAQAFLDWLAGTDQHWLVVLDNVTTLDAMSGWWPRPSLQGRGRVLATTRTADPRMHEEDRAATGLGAFVEVGAFDIGEAIEYLSTALSWSSHSRVHRHAATLVALRLRSLPLALAHAVAYMQNEGVSGDDYLREFHRRHPLEDEHEEPSYDVIVTTTVLMLLDVVWRHSGTDLRRAVLRLAAALDPAGHPAALWNTGAIDSYVRDLGNAADARGLGHALDLLERHALLTRDPDDPLRTVRLHPSTAQVVRDTVTVEVLPEVATAAAAALAELWPEAEHTEPALTAVLRANVEALSTSAGAALWESAGHEVLFLAGRSLLDSGLYTAAVRWWSAVWRQAFEFLRPDHPDTIVVRAELARCFRLSGQLTDALALAERTAADGERLLSPDDPAMLLAYGELAAAYWETGRTAEAVALSERTVSTGERILGPDHPRTLAARHALAVAYRNAGRHEEALAVGQESLDTGRRVLGPDHISILGARRELAASYRTAGRVGEALPLTEETLRDAVRLLGEDHPLTVGTRGDLAVACRQAGRLAEALNLGEHLLADCTRLYGPDAPQTVHAGTELEATRRSVDRAEDERRRRGPLERLFREHVSWLYPWIQQQLVRDPAAAEDVLQATMMRVMEDPLSKLATSENPRSYLMATARREAVGHLQRAGREALLLDARNWDAPLPDDPMALSDQQLDVQAALSALPSRQRQALELTMAGYTTDGIAEGMGISRPAVRVLLSRARASMAAALGRPARPWSVRASPDKDRPSRTPGRTD